MITGLGGKGKKTYNLPVGSLLINALKRITSHVINYAALCLFPHYTSQNPVPFHTHNLMGTLTLNKMKRRKEKLGTFIWARRGDPGTHQGTQQQHQVSPLTSLGHSLHFHLPQKKGKPLWRASVCAGRRHSCFLLLIFQSLPCWFGVSNRLFKSFSIRAALHFKEFLERLNCVQGRRIKLLTLAIRQSWVFNSRWGFFLNMAWGKTKTNKKKQL